MKFDLTSRECPIHKVSGGYVFNEDFTKTVIMWHPLYEKWSMPGGHVENGMDYISTALNEVYEETGLSILKVVGSIDPYLTWAKTHVRKGKRVRGHIHISKLYAIIANETEPLIPESNYDIAWVDISQALFLLPKREGKLLQKVMREAHM